MARATDERWLVDAAKAGDRAAFTRLVERYETRLYMATYRLLGNPDDAHDIVQETFLRAYRGIARTDDALNVGAWLNRIALNAARDLLRRRRLRLELPLEFYAHHTSARPDDSPLSALIEAEERRDIRLALELLPAHYRQALLLHEFSGQSCKAIGAIMGMSALRIKQLLYRSRAAFRAAYQGIAAVPAAVEATGTGGCQGPGPVEPDQRHHWAGTAHDGR